MRKIRSGVRGDSWVGSTPPPQQQGLENIASWPHNSEELQLAGGSWSEASSRAFYAGPALPSGISLFPTGFYISEGIIACVNAPVPYCQPL